MDEHVGSLVAEPAQGTHGAAFAAMAETEREVGLGGRQLPGGLLEAVDGDQHGAGVAEQALARIGKPHTPARALEQCQAELVLELADPLRQGRGGHVEAPGGAPEVTFLGDGYEVAQAAEIDVRHIRTVAARPRHVSSIVIGSDMIRVPTGRGHGVWSGTMLGA